MTDAIHQILTDAVEGPGIAYWASGASVKRAGAAPRYVTSFIVTDAAPDGEPVKTGSKTINARAIMAARNALVNGDIAVRRDIAAQFVGKPEDWECDSEGVDALIQAAFFGKITYG